MLLAIPAKLVCTLLKTKVPAGVSLVAKNNPPTLSHHDVFVAGAVVDDAQTTKPGTCIAEGHWIFELPGDKIS